MNPQCPDRKGDRTMNWLQKEFKRAEERRATLPPHARPVLTRGSFASVLEEGDTGEALLPCRPKWAALLDADESVDQAKVNGQGVHADRDGSERPALPAPPVHNHDLDPTCRETRDQHDRLVGECLKAPRADNPLHGSARTRGAEESIPAVPDREHIVTVPRERVEAFREWLSRPSGSFSAGPRLTFEAVEGETFWVRTRPWRLKP